MSELTPEERRRIYLEERARFEAQESLRQASTSKRRNRIGLGCLGVVAFVILWLSFGSYLMDREERQERAMTPYEREQKMKDTCRTFRAYYGSKPISELSAADLGRLQNCQRLGY